MILSSLFVDLTLMDDNYTPDGTLSTKEVMIPCLKDMIENKQEQTIEFNKVKLNNMSFFSFMNATT